jgi:hypothetical protein
MVDLVVAHLLAGMEKGARMIEERHGLNEISKSPEEFTRGRMKKVVQIEVEGAKLYSIGSLPVYDVAIKISVKRWRCTGPSRYRHVTERSRFKFQVSARDGLVLGWQTEASPDRAVSSDSAFLPASEHGDGSGLLRRAEELLSELVGVGG